MTCIHISLFFLASTNICSSLTLSLPYNCTIVNFKSVMTKWSSCRIFSSSDSLFSSAIFSMGNASFSASRRFVRTVTSLEDLAWLHLEHTKLALESRGLEDVRRPSGHSGQRRELFQERFSVMVCLRFLSFSLEYRDALSLCTLFDLKIKI